MIFQRPWMPFCEFFQVEVTHGNLIEFKWKRKETCVGRYATFVVKINEKNLLPIWWWHGYYSCPFHEGAKHNFYLRTPFILVRDILYWNYSTKTWFAYLFTAAKYSTCNGRLRFIHEFSFCQFFGTPFITTALQFPDFLGGTVRSWRHNLSKNKAEISRKFLYESIPAENLTIGDTFEKKELITK